MLSPRLLACLLLACLLIAGAPRAAVGEEAPADIVARLGSPLAAERRAAVEALLARGSATRPWARGWIRSPSRALRLAGWRLLAHLGEAADVGRATAALADDQPEVGRAAAEALLRLVRRLAPPPEPWIPSGSLATGQVRALAWALAADLLESPAGALPPWLSCLGEGLVPCLEHVLQHPRFEVGARRAALPALAAVGGDEARRVLGRFVPALVETEDGPLWEAWWRALVEIGPGRGHEAAHELVVAFAREATGSRWSDRPPGLRLRNQVHFYRFLATCPPAEGRETVAAYLDDLLESSAHGGASRLSPSLAAEAVRAHLVLASPDDARLRWDALAARPPRSNGWARRQEELGEVLALLEPYRTRAGLQRGLTELLDHQGLPASVFAWARFLQGAGTPEEHRGLALGLIDADGGAATTAQRRLGARLLDRLGPVAPERIRRSLADLDAWMRAMGLRWAQRAATAGRFSAAEHAAALSAALADPDAGLFLLGAELAAEPLGGPARERLLALAVSGPRTWRSRSWRVIEGTLVGGGPSAGEGFAAPGGNAALDERLRAAGRVRRLWAAGAALRQELRGPDDR